MKVIIKEGVEEFISSLEKSTLMKVVRTIELLERFEYRLGMPHSKKIDKNLFELRIQGKQKVRIFYGFVDGKIILHLGYIKKSNKIPGTIIKSIKKLYIDII